MDPFAHTIVGLALAKGGLERRSGFATAALVIGANLPDVDGLNYLISADQALFFHLTLPQWISAVLAGAAIVFLKRARRT